MTTIPRAKLESDRPPWPAGEAVRASLFWRLFSTNAVVITLAVAVLALSPITVSWPLDAGEAAILISGLAIMLAVNFILMRRALAPLGRLWQAMRSVDPLRPGGRIEVGAKSIEVTELTAACNAMLERLETERRESARRAQAAQETERRRLARELHDEVGQNLTALILQIELAARAGDERQRGPLDDCRETARGCLDRIREIARGLRPETLDDLGLQSALSDLCERIGRASGLRITRRYAAALTRISADAELVIYRVAQESLTNVIRHAEASHAEVELTEDDAGLTLRVCDDGRGVAGAREGSGITGMRERALLIGARLTVAAASDGSEVRLEIPAAEIIR